MQDQLVDFRYATPLNPRAAHVMPRTTAIAFPLALFLAWYVHVVIRAGNGPGFHWDRLPGDAAFTATIMGVVFVAFGLMSLMVLYFTRNSGGRAGRSTLIVPALSRYVGAYLAAVVIGVALAEWYCVADEQAFERESAMHLSAARLDSALKDVSLYSRPRWWPASAQVLVSQSPDGR